VRASGRGRVDITVGSALDIFGGALPYSDVVAWHRRQAANAAAAAAGAS
jgi:phosphoribosylformimino-5-aminoimidazole carboxamide ribotide isomerase